MTRSSTGSGGRAATPIYEGGLDQFVTLSIGVSPSTSATMLPSLPLGSADIAMYQAKRSGPGRYVVFAEHDDDIAGHSLRTSNELHRAIQESQLVMHYQPFVDLDQLTVVGTEARSVGSTPYVACSRRRSSSTWPRSAVSSWTSGRGFCGSRAARDRRGWPTGSTAGRPAPAHGVGQHLPSSWPRTASPYWSPQISTRPPCRRTSSILR